MPPSLLSIALGAFAIGTEGFMLAGLLPAISADVGVPVSLVGQLVTVFSLTYALGSPLWAVATATLDRRRLLMAAMAVFGLGNLLAATAHGYAALLGARVVMALSASTFMPAASAYAAAAAPPERRGRALSVIYAGMTLATVVGVPLGVLVGGRLGWRSTFLGVAGLALAAMAGIFWSVGKSPGSARVGLGQRLAVARRPEVLGTLAITAVAMAGVFSLYTYLAAFLGAAAEVRGPALAAVLFLFGAGGAVGNLLGGVAADRASWRRLVSAIFGSLAVVYALLSGASGLLPLALRRPALVVLVLCWGLIGWAFPSIQQSRLVRLDPSLASITLSLNASATYLGISAGAVLGSLVVARGAVLSLGWVAAGCMLLGLGSIRFVAPGPMRAGPRPRRADVPVLGPGE